MTSYRPTSKAAAILMAVAAGALASCTANPAPPAGSAAAARGGGCFPISQVNGFAGNADGSVDVTVGANQYYRLTTIGACPNANWNMQIGIQSRTGGDFVCNGYDAQLVIPDPMGTQRCQISSITPLTTEQYRLAHP